jgi:tRNA/tmRNA/rRNA uracil-C5-methylase (TrmA/RlmC/RlmD family)
MLSLAKESSQKLEKVALSLAPWHKVPTRLTCNHDDEHVGYRCRCTFQIVVSSSDEVQYAIRRDQQAEVIYSFPIANVRIQHAMIGVEEHLNGDGVLKLHNLRKHLTSVTFSSSWKDTEDMDCFLTLHYGSPIDDEALWQAQAQHLSRAVNLTQITGRSKNRITRALPDVQSITRDFVCLSCPKGTSDWSVTLLSALDANESSSSLCRVVEYHKPEGAFCHPNSIAMCRSLEWMLCRLSAIESETGRLGRMLEMYCGCGAHTAALMRSGLLCEIVAVELDKRLVDACRINLALNQTTKGQCKKYSVHLADAGNWAKQNLTGADFDILLVDPPRYGLDDRVCHMAINGIFQHVLYISCGHEALVKDLRVLSKAFDVVDCMLIDLFPQTASVESLVHLRRRKYQ